MKRITRIIRPIICMAVLLFAMTTAVMGCYQKESGSIDIPGRTPSGTSAPQPSATPAGEVIPSVDRQAELAEARAKNPDTVVWLYIPGAEVDDPVMQAEDNPLFLLPKSRSSSKTLRTSFGDVEVSVPRDRKSEFDPIILKKNQTSISQEIEAKIISMYSKGMTTGDIEAHVRDIYGVEISDTTISRITDKILPKAKEWQQRPLEAIYAVVFLDAIHYHVRSEGQIVKKAVYIAIGIDLDGRKDVLGMWIGENESAKFWATVLNSLKNRGVEDIFIACTDNLNGFSAAIEAVYPKTEIQNCIIHQLRNSSKYVAYKDLKALMADLKAVYGAVDEPTALDALDVFSEQEVPQDFSVLEGQLGESQYLFQVPAGAPAADLHHKYD